MELRRDYILDRWVIVATQRKDRPRDFVRPVSIEKKNVCPFCPGNETLTTIEIGRIEEKGTWKIRWVPNKFAAAKKEGTQEIRTDNTYFTFGNPYGSHEVIIETPKHDNQFSDLSVAHIEQLLGVYAKRIQELSKEQTTKYVVLFKNSGPEAGTSLEHSHTQVISLNILPSIIKEEIAASHRQGTCAYCEILSIEKGSDRRCFENSTFVAFTPYASRFNYEIWVFPKRHVRRLDELSKEELHDAAQMMKQITQKLSEVHAPYNFFVHYAPGDSDLHLHLEIIPRTATWAGFEYASDIVINSVSPETAAAFFRGEIN